MTAQFTSPAVASREDAQAAMGRGGRPEEIAALVTFSLFDSASYINKQVVTASGKPL